MLYYLILQGTVTVGKLSSKTGMILGDIVFVGKTNSGGVGEWVLDCEVLLASSK